MKISRCLLFSLTLLGLLNGVHAATTTISNNQTSSVSVTNGNALVVTSTGNLTVSAAQSVSLTGTTTVTNSGTIANTRTDSRAIRANAAGVSLTLTNNTGALIRTSDGDTVRMSNGDNVALIHNYGQIISLNANAGGAQAIDLAAITTGSNYLNNHSTGLIQASAADAVRMGVNGIVINDGTIRATPVAEAGNLVSGSDGIDAQANKGQQITNSGLISGRHGITGGSDDIGQAADFTMTITNQTGGTITGVNGSGINIDGSMVAGDTAVVTVTNHGTITGNYDTAYATGDGDGVDVDGTLNLDNYGIVRAMGSSGTVGAETNNAEGVSMGGGTVINRAGAEISGQNTTGTDAAGNGILIDDSNGGNAIGAASITNSGTIRGYSGFGIKAIGTYADTIVNESTGLIRGAGASSGAAIQTGGGADQVTNRGIITGDNGAAIDLGAGADTLRIEGNAASITGSVNGGTESDTLIVNAGTGNTFTTASVFSNFETVQLQSGTTVLQGANRIAAGATLELSDATLKFESIGAANGQSFTNFTLTGDAVIDLGNTTSLTFGAFDDITLGASLSVIGYDQGLSPTYALRFSGNWLSDGDFSDFLNNLTINGGQALASYDGSYTTLSVPEPSSAALLGLATAALFLRLRRRRA